MKKRSSLLAINRYLGTILIAGLFLYIWTEVYSRNIISPIYWKGNVLFLLLYLLVFSAFCEMYGGYDIGHRQLNEVVFANFLALLITNFLVFIISSLIARRMLGMGVYTLLSLGQMLVILLWAYSANKIYFILSGSRKLLLVTDQGQQENRLKNKFDGIPQKYTIAEVISANTDLAQIKTLLPSYDGIILQGVKESAKREIVNYCFYHNIFLYIYPEASDILTRASEIIVVGDMPVFYFHNRYIYRQIVKRSLDIVIAVSLLLVSLPILFIAMLAIFLEDQGQIIYSQKRVGQHGKEFTLYKFRSMIKNSETGVALLSRKNDERVTKVGAVLRRFHIDELPQLFNILRGDMSLVGPRPERPELISHYKKAIPEYDFRLKVQAGLTGYAQVIGKYNTSPEDKLKLDLLYIENYSFIMDLKIILLTIKAIFTKSSTEGFD